MSLSDHDGLLVACPLGPSADAGRYDRCCVRESVRSGRVSASRSAPWQRGSAQPEWPHAASGRQTRAGVPATPDGPAGMI